MRTIVYTLLAEGFEEVEALAPVDLLRRAGIETVTVSIEKERVVTGARGVSVVADLLFEELEEEKMKMVILPGGYPGYENLGKDERVAALLKKAVAEGLDIAAICGAPSVLGGLGLLEGRVATCYPGMEPLLGCAHSMDAVVEDGPFITSRGAGTALEFSLALVARLAGREKAEELRRGIVML
ncbi:MAG: DJ-1/PfpI family protein [Clostridia bacterium]|nr:DJ-1/PfpI family protein [Clostridia bacterium]